MQEPTSFNGEHHLSPRPEESLNDYSVESDAAGFKRPPNRSLKKISVLVLLFVLVQLIFGLSGSTSPVLAAKPEVISGQEVALIASGRDEPANIPPPQNFSRKSGAAPTSKITVTYTGFTPAAQAAFQYAVDIWASLLVSPVEIKVIASFEPLPTNLLGFAGPFNAYRNFPKAPYPDVFYPIALVNKYVGYDYDPANPDITARFSSSYSNWYYGVDGKTPSGKYDFVSVVLHELCHGLGFVSSMTINNNGTGSWGLGSSPPSPLIFDRFIVNGGDKSLINTALFPNPSTALAAQLTSDFLSFNGPAAKTAMGGIHTWLYAPSVFVQGSSICHLDELFNGTPDALMTYSIGMAESIHDPGPVGLAIMKDIGWDVAPAAPSNLVATAISGKINLTWKDNSANETGFVVERKNAATAAWVTIATTAADAVSYSDTSGLAGQTYYYQVTASNASGKSAPSNTATVTIPFPAPSNLVATAISGKIDLTWTDNSTNETGFVVERKNAATAAWVTIATTAANAVGYSDTSGLAGQTYYYQVSAYNASGKSASSNTATVTIGPLAPSNLVATPITGTVSLTWKDNSTDETGFIVERKDLAAKTGWATIGTPAANTVVYTDTFGLSSGQLYYYQVRASNGTGNSAPSNQVSVVTPGGCPVTSAADSGLNTLRAALSNATCTSITFPSPITITITSPTPELKVSPSVKILGICSATGPGVVIKGTGVTGSGLTLGGKNTIFGVKISGFTGPGPLLLDTTLGNQLACVNTTR